MKILIRNSLAPKWEVVESFEYLAENELQKLLAESPSLISISEIREDSAPLVAAIREVGLPGSGYTDILAFSPKGDVVILECKLAANPEIKRKVIAQVLEYGAYLWGMSYEDLNMLVLNRTNKNLAELVGEAAGDPEWDEEGFRSSVEEYLRRGAFILVIAVDEMNEELSRTIRYLNTCGNPEFAFTALEMRRFQKADIEILVPHLFGAVKTDAEKKHETRRKQWTKEEFFEAARVGVNPTTFELLVDIYTWAEGKADRLLFGIGQIKGSFTFYYLINGKTISVFSVYTTGGLVINYGSMSTHVSEDLLMGFHRALVEIPPFKSITADFTRWPSFKVDEVFEVNPDYLIKFKTIVEDLGQKVHVEELKLNSSIA
jgi:hypothetical protein